MQLSTGIKLHTEETLTIDSLFEKLGKSGMNIEVTLDEQVDPAEYRVIQVDELGQEKLVFAQPADHGFGIFDLVNVLDRLGFHVDYEEVK